jgi:hypothetical protein
VRFSLNLPNFEITETKLKKSTHKNFYLLNRAVLAAVASMPLVAFDINQASAAEASISAITNVYINGNTNNFLNPEQESQGVFITTSGSPKALYDSSGNFLNLSDPSGNTPFSGSQYLNTGSSFNTSSTSQFSGNYAPIVDASGNPVVFGNTTQGRDASGNLLPGGGLGDNNQFTGVSGSGSSAGYDASGNLISTQAFIGNQSNRSGSLDPVSGTISTAAYDASGNVQLATNSSGAAANVGGTDATSYSTQIAGSDGSGGALASNTSFATTGGATAFSTQTAVQVGGFDLATNTSGAFGGGSASFNSQVVGEQGGALNLSGVANLDGGAAGSSAIRDASGNLSTFTGVRHYDGLSLENTAGTSTYLNVDPSGNKTTGASIVGGANNGGMYLDSNGVTVGRVDGQGNRVGNSQIHGVAAGTAPTDAVNVSQLNQGLNGLKAGIASTVAMANIPQVEPGKRFALGMGLGHYSGASALSVGGSIRINESAVIKGSIGHSFNTSGPADGTSSTAAGVGAAFSW